jgi:NADPH-dependent ferric siderophore reductase
MGSSDPIRPVRVERIVQLDPTMVRVTFAVVGCPAPAEVRIPAGHCRLIFADAKDPARRWPRVFTYRKWHPDGHFDVDFALHSGTGPAALWIARAAVGDVIGWKHGGGPKLTLEDAPAGPLLAFGDATALPVISALLEHAHPRLKGLLFLDLPPAARPEPIDAPPGIMVRLLHPRTTSDALEDVRGLGLVHPATVFVACEAGRMRALRRLALDDLRVAREHVFTSGYWKAGLTTEEVDAAKRQPEWFGDVNGSTQSNRNPGFGDKVQPAVRAQAPS